MKFFTYNKLCNDTSIIFDFRRLDNVNSTFNVKSSLYRR